MNGPIRTRATAATLPGPGGRPGRRLAALASTRLLLTALLITALLLNGCAKHRRAAPSAEASRGVPGAAAGGRNRATSDPGSRYLDTSGPLGGIAVETAPIPEGAPYPARVPTVPAPSGVAAHEPAPSDAPLPPPRIRILPPPPLPSDDGADARPRR